MKHWNRWGAYGVVCMLGIFFLMGGTQRLETELLSEARQQEISENLMVKKGTFGILDRFEDKLEEDTQSMIKVFAAEIPPVQEEKILGGARLTLLANQTISQMLSAVIETSKGSLIVVDGGTPDDAGHLLETIRAKGGHVSAWLITHPHVDHIGALDRILNQTDSQITIDNIYYSFADLAWYYQKEAKRADTVAQFMTTLFRQPQEKLHGDIKKGTEIIVDDAKITVMNQCYLFDKNSINNSSIAYTIEVNKKYIVFLGDMGEEAGNQLLEDYDSDELNCDILQMAHHGQNGVNERTYRILRPKICLWPTPEWLWNNDYGTGKGSGPWLTLQTRSWMENLGINRNYVIKDGDQVIE